ncbi:MAG: MFS transporter [Deltaproteobacteria bacterium]|nr:MFS transporter [Deltaproteobacteria bacterium]
MKGRLIRIAWYFYDFANSSYSAVIAATIFPVYYAKEIVGNENHLGDALWGKAISLSMALCAIFAPYLGSLADRLQIRKKMLLFFTSLCVVSVASLSFLKKGMAIEGFMLTVLANFSMEIAFVFYNSFLTAVESNVGKGRTSAIGFATGYLGSIISLVLSLFLLNEGYIELIWLMCALFFFIFSLPSFLFLPSETSTRRGISITQGLKDVLSLTKRLIRNKDLRYFIIGYIFYEDGINTVIVFSSLYAASTLSFSAEELVYLYISIQAAAMVGAFIISAYVERMGYKRTTTLSLWAWAIITFIAAFVTKKLDFTVLCLCGALFLGVLQASSRALFATFIPNGEESKYFGVYGFVGKSSAIIGPLMFGIISYMTKSQRISVVFVSFLFFVSIIFLSRVKEEKPT